MHVRKDLRTLALACGLAALAGCAAPPARLAPAPASAPITLVLFGDHGYDLDYLESGDKQPPLTLAEAIAAEREEWIEDKRPPAEFKATPMVRLAETGGYVAASGLMPVVKAITDHCRLDRCDAAVMLGDNIYPNGPTGGADGVSDARRFDEILLTPFKGFASFAPDFRIYAALGNHDWRTSREAALGEVAYMERTRPFYMDGLIYRVTPPGHPDVELFVLDTEVLLAGETVYKAELADDGSELPGRVVQQRPEWARPQTDRERNMVAWLEAALRDSPARWKIVMAHHPIWSSAGSKFQEARVLRRLLLPTLCRYADMYFAGHEHTIELHSDSCARALPGETVLPLPEIVSGAASKQRPLNSWFMAQQARANPELTTYYAKGMTWGYMTLTLDGDRARVDVFSTPDDGSGRNVLETSRTFDRRTGKLPR
jgi:hypothetical protein